MRHRVFAIGHDKPMLEELHRALADLECTSRQCTDEREAICTLPSFNPDLILCQDEMPRIRGRQLGRLFKRHARLAKVPFLLMIGEAPAEADFEAMDLALEADDILQWPMENEHLRAVIHAWLLTLPVARPASWPLEASEDYPGGTRRVVPWHHGRTAPVSLTRMMCHVIRNGDTGVLDVHLNRRFMRATIVAGTLCDLDSNYLREDALGRRLIQHGVIDEKQNEQSLAWARGHAISQGRALIALSLIDEATLDSHMCAHKIDKFRKLFTAEWEGAAYSFSLRAVENPTGALPGASLQSMLHEAVFRFFDRMRMYEAFRRRGRETTKIELAEPFAEIVAELRLSAEEKRLAETFAGKTIKEIIDRNPLDFDKSLPLAFLLVCAKALVFRSGTPAWQSIPTSTLLQSRNTGKTDAMMAYRLAIGAAQSLMRKRAFLEAQVELRKALEINPDSAHALALLAWSEYRAADAGNVAVCYGAKQMLRRAITLDDHNELPYLYMSRILSAEGKHGLAQSFLRRARELNPETISVGRRPEPAEADWPAKE